MEERNNQFSTNYLFNAKELDNETGLYYYGARYLDPTGAMWLSVDPMWEKFAGMTPYKYCMGNPVVMVDPDGRDLEDSETKRTAFIISMNASSMANTLEKDMNDYPESCDVAETKARIAQLRKTVEDINVMKNDKKHVYKFTKTNCLVGETKVDADGRHIEILYNENDLANLVHEIRHGGQRARGEMNFADCDDEYGNPSVIKSHDYDILKEIDAYSAQVAYGGKMEIDLYCEENDEHYKNNIILIENGYGQKKIITHVYDVTIDFVRSIREKEPDLLGRYKNIRVYGSW